MIFLLLISCSSDDEAVPTTEPQKEDNITIENVVGTYIPYRVYFENSNDIGFFEYKQKITFNADQTGFDFTYNGDHIPFD